MGVSTIDIKEGSYIKKILIIIVLASIIVAISPYVVQETVTEDMRGSENFYKVVFGWPVPFLKQALPIGPIPSNQEITTRARFRFSSYDFDIINFIISVTVVSITFILIDFILSRLLYQFKN